MFDKVEYSDLYKFLTSVGLILIGSSIVIPWLFLREELNVELSVTEYNNLMEPAKQLVDDRNSILSFFITALPWASFVLFLTGLLTSFYGLKNWRGKQKIVDETENLQLTKLRAEIKPLLPSEIKSKAQQEVSQELSATDSQNQLEAQEATTNEESQKKIEELSLNLMDMERFFFQKIIDYNTFDYKCEQNVKIAGKYEIDIVLSAFDTRKRLDKFFEIKYLQNNLSMQVIRDSFSQLKRARAHYTAVTKRGVYPILIIIYKTDIASQEQIGRFIRAINEFKEEIPDGKIQVLTDQESKDFDIGKLIGP